MDHRLSRRTILLGGTALAAASAIGSAAAARTAQAQQQMARRPNILVIFGDAFGPTFVSPCSPGVLGEKTPNIGRIAREGLMLTDCYAEQSWAAGQSSFSTGQVTLRTGLCKAGDPALQDPAIADLLKPLGYATGRFGKSQQEDGKAFVPGLPGFGEFYDNFNRRNAEPAAALDFMDRQVRANKPFFCWFNSARSPATAGMAWHDAHVGLLLKTLDDLGIENDTIVVYTASTGQLAGRWPYAASPPFRSEKQLNRDAASRVPCMIRWPGRIAAGRISNEIVSGLDWLPTLLAAAGEPEIKQKLLEGHRAAGKTFKVHLDGYNQLPFLLGQQERSARSLFFYFSHDGDLTGMRFENWAIDFNEQRTTGAIKFHLPRLFDLRANTQSNSDYDWFISQPSLSSAAYMEACKFLATFKDFPPRRRAAGFSIDPIIEDVRYALTIGA